MPDLSHQPIEIEDWKGLFARGFSDSAPPGYFIDTLNTKFTESDVLSRDGSVLEFSSTSANGIGRFFQYKKLTGSRIIYQLEDAVAAASTLMDSTAVGFGIIQAPDNPIHDFSMINYNNRAYITSHDRSAGITGQFLLVYDDINIGALARRAAGVPPTGYVLAAVNSATVGNCEAGTHLIAVVNISNSGFITAPGPALFVPVVCTGGFKIDVSNVQPGPTGTVARAIVATKAIQTYNGNQLGYEFFQVPSANGGLIGNNVGTTTSVSFYDSELLSSVDYLFDNRQTIPAGVGITEYKGRLILWGFPADPHSVYLSKPYAPEEFDSVGGIITVDPFESHSSVRNCFTFRGSLIICKSNRIYQTTDNGGDPSTWQTDIIDNGAGTECFGVGVVIDSKGQENDRAFIADRSGLLIFEGYAKRPEATWLVEDIWKRINKSVFNKVQVVTDPITSSLYITLPLDSSTVISHLLFGYYGGATGYYGFDPKQIKWSLWQFVQGTTSILVDLDSTTSESVFKYSGILGTNNVYSMKQNGLIHNDAGSAFQSFVKTALYGTRAGWISHFAGLKLRVQGVGTLILTILGLDDIDTVTPATVTLAALPGKEIFVPTNFQNEKASIKFSVNAVGSYFKLTTINLFAKALWFTRPS